MKVLSDKIKEQLIYIDRKELKRILKAIDRANKYYTVKEKTSDKLNNELCKMVSEESKIQKAIEEIERS